MGAHSLLDEIQIFMIWPWDCFSAKSFLIDTKLFSSTLPSGPLPPLSTESSKSTQFTLQGFVSTLSPGSFPGTPRCRLGFLTALQTDLFGLEQVAL